MTRAKYNIKIVNISSLLLALLIISINIREPFFHIREILFFLTMLASIRTLDLKQAKYAAILIAIWVVCVFFNIIVPGSHIDFSNGGFETVIISAYLLLMCFFQKRYASAIIKSYIFVSVVVALITISIWLICNASESAYYSIREYFLSVRETRGLTWMALDYRTMLGFRYLTVWYRTAPCMICSLGYCLAQRLMGGNKHTFEILLLTIALILSGTRANILAAILLVVIYVAFLLYQKGLNIIPAVIFATIVIFAVILGVRFLNDVTSRSSAVKISDLRTYLSMFRDDPLRALFFGWGPGTSFYSEVRNLVINSAELSLFESIRKYGLFFTCVIMFGIWFVPFRSKNFQSLNYYKYYYYCVFAAYMLAAFTNPYLLDSVGFCALLFFRTSFEYGNDAEILHVVR